MYFSYCSTTAQWFLSHISGFKSVQFLPSITPESMKEAKSCLSQPNKVIWRKTGQGVTLPCTVTPPCSDKDLQFEWFFFKENVHLRLTSLNNPLKYVPNGAFLHISSLHVNDSGIYHCAAVTHGDSALGSQHVGSGTTLVVRGKRENCF